MTNNRNDLTADKIENGIGQMFSNFNEEEFKPTEYSIFFNPQKSSFWFIVIYFTDNNSFNIGMKNGLCYQIYSYLLNQLNSISETSNIDKSISFEIGKRPTEIVDIENVLGQLIAKIHSQQKVAGNNKIKICGNCGHDFDKHQLMCNLVDNNTAPNEGWMICPEENCNCFQTWGANYKEETKKINIFSQFFKKIFK